MACREEIFRGSRSNDKRLVIRRRAFAGFVLICSLAGRGLEAEPTGFTAGRLLVATEEMRDPRFVETVIYMVEHNGGGAMGIVINRPLAKGAIADLLKGLGVESKQARGDIIVHYGGPVSPDVGFILHSDDVMLENSTKIRDGIAMTTDVKLIEAISRGKGPRQALLAVGYAGWAPGQLEEEMKGNAWLVIPGDRAFVFGIDPDKKWRQAIDKRQVPL